MGHYTAVKSFCIFKRLGLMFVTRNSAVADKPRDAFVQMQGVADLKHASHHCVTMPNLVVLR